MVGEPPPEEEISLIEIKNLFPGPSENDEYLPIGPDHEDTALYEYIKQCSGRGVRQSLSWIIMTGLSTEKVLVAKSVPRGCKKVKVDGDRYLDTPTLLDFGSAGGAATEALDNKASLYTLKPRNIAVHTVNGTSQINYKRRKIKIKIYKGVIRNYDSIVVKKIGKEDAETKSYIQVIVDLFQMKEVHKEYILNKVSRDPMEIHLILGLRAQESFMLSIQTEQLGYIHPK